MMACNITKLVFNIGIQASSVTFYVFAGSLACDQLRASPVHIEAVKNHLLRMMALLFRNPIWITMMMSSNGNIFRVTGPVFSLICIWINGLVNNREAGELRRYRAHYDVTVMTTRVSWTKKPKYRKSPNISGIKTPNVNVSRFTLQLPSPIHLYQLLRREWRCSRGSTDWRCYNYIRVIILLPTEMRLLLQIWWYNINNWIMHTTWYPFSVTYFKTYPLVKTVWWHRLQIMTEYRT